MGNPDLLDAQQLTAHLGDLKDTLAAIREISNASLDAQFEGDDLDRLRNPVEEELDIDDQYFRLSLDMYLILANAPQETYRELVAALLRFHPEAKGKLLSYDQIKRRVKDLTGIVPIYDNMCINSCMAFTGPYKDLDACLECLEPRHDPAVLRSSGSAIKKPRQSMTTIPIGPQIQALWSHRLSAEKMGYRQRVTDALLDQLELPDILTDYTEGQDYLDNVAPHLKPHDTVLMFSTDGAQLYRNKKSDCWMYIWVIYDLAPGDRYKKRYVLPGGFVPGPNTPKNFDSFFFSGVYHLSALQREGLIVWDARDQQLHRDDPFLHFTTADAIGIADVSGSAGHHARLGCRLMCELTGRHKPGTGHYYPALLKPCDCDHRGSNHDDINVNTISGPDHKKYQANLQLLLSSANSDQHAQHRRETGISKPSIFQGLSRVLPLPRCFPGDIMHQPVINLCDLLISLWRGQMKLYGSDKKDTWDWAVFMDSQRWKEHGKEVASTSLFFPSSFGRPPRNPADKLSSGYKAWELLLYIYGLGPGIFYGVLPDKYYKHFCKLVFGIHTVYQRSVSVNSLEKADFALRQYVIQFEEFYYQRKIDRLQFVRQCLHSLTHLASETLRCGPLSGCAQWCMESAIGSFGREVRSHSNMFANIANRGVLRAQINAIKARIPDLEPDPALPHGSFPFGDGYALLWATDSTRRPVSNREAEAIRASGIVDNSNQSAGPICILRWARLLLPNGQVSRCTWKEKSGAERVVRCARNVKARDQWHPVALISLYSAPDPALLETSSGTLLVCQYHGDNSLVLVEAQAIKSVVAMVPFMEKSEGSRPRCHSGCFFVVEKPGLSLAELGMEEGLEVS
ncbi:hypothetical protein BDM02DRAFT_3104994 [Thelephora ganbajun]|uniref:Uncharacterized protein n=1 Tax=Thelephora ganbajun TaxID=370292 RepID=A0ACB6Z0D0_THEGA|nr:hypothetical protein BDM02DRAFT_3104994 [Thelephora ganbajun]